MTDPEKDGHERKTDPEKDGHEHKTDPEKDSHEHKMTDPEKDGHDIHDSKNGAKVKVCIYVELTQAAAIVRGQTHDAKP